MMDFHEPDFSARSLTKADEKRKRRISAQMQAKQ